MLHKLIMCLAATITCGDVFADADNSIKARALLDGAKHSRESIDWISGDFEMGFGQSENVTATVRGRFYSTKKQTRFDLFNSGAKEFTIHDGVSFYGFRRRPHNDLEVFDIDHADQVKGVIAFDPRVLGLSDILPCRVTVSLLFAIGNENVLSCSEVETTGTDKTFIVKKVRGDTTFEYWIKEPSFRILRTTISWPDALVDVRSEFDGLEDHDVIPSKVTCTRTEQGISDTKVYTMSNVDQKTPIGEETFSLKVMDLPLDTPVIDYRIQQRIGYWDGEKIARERVVRRLNQSDATAMDRTRFNALSFIWLGFLSVGAYFLLKRRWRKPGAS
jgi:hypothetical protein